MIPENTDTPLMADCSSATCSASSFETVEMIRQEWMTPGFYSEGDGGRPYPGYVAVKTNIGWLLLGCVERFQTSTAGGYRHRLLRDGEIHQQKI